MNRSESLDLLLPALKVVQAELKAARKDCYNEFFKSHYADLSAVYAVTRTLLAANGFVLVQTPGYLNEGTEALKDVGKDKLPIDVIVERAFAILTTTLFHESGQFIEWESRCRLTNDNAQGYAAAITYLRRVNLISGIGVDADADDDGNAATGKTTPAQTAKKLTMTRTETKQAEGDVFNAQSDELMPPPERPVNFGALKTEINEYVKLIAEKTDVSFEDVIAQHTTWAKGEKFLTPETLMRVAHDAKGAKWLEQILAKITETWEVLNDG